MDLSDKKDTIMSALPYFSLISPSYDEKPPSSSQSSSTTTVPSSPLPLPTASEESKSTDTESVISVVPPPEDDLTVEVFTKKRKKSKKRSTSKKVVVAPSAGKRKLKKRKSTTTTEKRVVDTKSSSSSTDFNWISDLLNTTKLTSMSTEWLHELQSSFDHLNLFTTTTTRNLKVALCLRSSSSAVLAGYRFVESILVALDSIKPFWIFDEGSNLVISPDSEVQLIDIQLATILCPAPRFIALEELLPQILTRCSSIATAATKLKASLLERGWVGQLTAGSGRYTTPGSFGLVEEYGLMLGMGASYRGYIEITRKELAFSGAKLEEWVAQIRRTMGPKSKLKVQVTSLKSALAALAAGADILRFICSPTPDDDDDTLSAAKILSIASKLKSQPKSTKTTITTTTTTSLLLIEVELTLDFSLDAVSTFAVPSIDIITVPRLLQEVNSLEFYMRLL